jgi:pterin 4 alpha carbinolamine dehydratase
MTETLAEKTCTPCRGGIPPLARDEALRFQKQAPDWELRDDARRIERTFRFRNFREALAFVQRRKMRPCIEQSNGPVSLSPSQSWPDCIINMFGYDFWKGQVEPTPSMRTAACCWTRGVCWSSDRLSSEGIFRRRAFALIYGHGQRSDVKVQVLCHFMSTFERRSFQVKPE